MSCCSGGYCKFKFPEGAPLLDNSVTSLNATYQFLPYGTLLQEGEFVRIWMESGKLKTVVIDEKIPIEFTRQGPQLKEGYTGSGRAIPWQLVALDSGFDYDDLMDWTAHPLYNPGETSYVVRYKHPIEVKPSLKARWLGLLYKLRNL